MVGVINPVSTSSFSTTTALTLHQRTLPRHLKNSTSKPSSTHICSSQGNRHPPREKDRTPARAQAARVVHHREDMVSALAPLSESPYHALHLLQSWSLCSSLSVAIEFTITGCPQRMDAMNGRLAGYFKAKRGLETGPKAVPRGDLRLRLPLFQALTRPRAC